MSLVNVTGFQRARRLAAEKANASEVEQKPAEAQNESEARPLSPDDVDGMDIEKVKEFLDHFEVKYAHNTGEAKLREKLKDAIG